MKIQKLVYYTHGYYLALHKGEPLLDELFEAWKFGPVLPSLYYEFREYGSDGIKHYACDPDGDHIAAVPDDEEVNELIDWVWDTYGHLSGPALSSRTHKKGGPWERVVSEHDGIIFRNQDIPNRYIREYFDNLVDK